MRRVWKLRAVFITLLCGAAAAQPSPPQDNSSPQGNKSYDTRYALGLIDDATFYQNERGTAPTIVNELLLEGSFDLHYRHRWSISTSLVGMGTTKADWTTPEPDSTPTQLRCKEVYGGLSAGDFDFTLGRKLMRWGTGYAFTPAGVLDPPRIPTDPTDRLNLNVGRDMVKADWVHGRHALTFAWSSAALAPASANLHDTTAVRYNTLLHGFDVGLIAGNDRGGSSFGALTFTRVLGQAWEVHSEAVWRDHPVLLVGAKYVTPVGVTFIGEFYTPPNTAFYRDPSVSPLAGRQSYAFFDVMKQRLREMPGWKEWDLDAYIVTNLNDDSYTASGDVNRRFGNHFSAYLHIAVPQGSRTSDYGATPYRSGTSIGVRFQL